METNGIQWKTKKKAMESHGNNLEDRLRPLNMRSIGEPACLASSLKDASWPMHLRSTLENRLDRLLNSGFFMFRGRFLTRSSLRPRQLAPLASFRAVQSLLERTWELLPWLASA